MSDIASIKIELNETKEIKSPEYWENLSFEEKAEVIEYRKALVAILKNAGAVPMPKGDVPDGKTVKTELFTFHRPPRPAVFDRYLF